MKKGLLALTLLSAVVLVPNANAETPEEKGLAIAKETKARNTGWGDSQAQMEMILSNKAGRETTRKVRVKSLEVEGDGDKGLSIFDEKESLYKQ